MTARIDVALQPLRGADGPAIECLTIADGPPGIQSQRDNDAAVGPLLKRAAELEESAAAFVIACFGDPGLHALREQSRRPVLGVAECAVLTALTMGQRFGVISTLPATIPRHLRYFAAMGVTGRLAGEVAMGVKVADLADGDRTLAAMTDAGTRLRDEYGADVIVMAGAGMSHCRDALEKNLDLPVVEPTQAAVAMAIGRVRLGWTA